MATAEQRPRSSPKLESVSLPDLLPGPNASKTPERGASRPRPSPPPPIRGRHTLVSPSAAQSILTLKTPAAPYGCDVDISARSRSSCPLDHARSSLINSPFRIDFRGVHIAASSPLDAIRDGGRAGSQGARGTTGQRRLDASQPRAHALSNCWHQIGLSYGRAHLGEP